VGRPLPRRRGPCRPVRGHFVETGACWGHFTMFNLREQDTAAIDAIYAEAFAS
jgi:hypothetical protein